MEIQYNNIIAYKDTKIYLKDNRIINTNTTHKICIIHYKTKVLKRFREWCSGLGVQIFELKNS